MHKSREGSSGGRALKRALFQPYENDAAYEPDVGASEAHSQHELYYFETCARPGRVEMRADQGAQGHYGKTHRQDEPRAGEENSGSYQPHHGELGQRNPRESLAAFHSSIS